jgi:hypothetical protein
MQQEPLELTMTIDEPTMTIDDPTIDEPTMTIDEPTMTIDDPTIDEPTMTIDEPTMTIDDPTIDELTMTIDEPTMTIDEPTMTIDEPTIYEPTMTIDEPTIYELTMTIEPVVIPRIVFIVPYRDREQQLLFFGRQMEHVLSDYSPGEYDVWYIHQADERPFNRGALKNIGVLIAMQKYSDDWQHITFVFNDIDTMPFSKGFLNYETVQGVVKHFFGFTFALGGIVSMTGQDFIHAGGFPNYWAWGYEDTELNIRTLRSGIAIDRSHFFPIMDKNILQFPDSVTRAINRDEYNRYKASDSDGISNISNLQYYVTNSPSSIGTMYNVTMFDTGIYPKIKDEIYLCTSGIEPFSNPIRSQFSLMTRRPLKTSKGLL